MFTFHVMDLTALRQGEVGGAVHGGVGGHSVVVSAVTLKEGHYTRTWEEGGTTSTHQDMGGGRTPCLCDGAQSSAEVEGEGVAGGGGGAAHPTLPHVPH